MTRTEAYLALNLLPKIGPVRVRRLLEVFETPEHILAAKARDIAGVQGFGHPRQVHGLARAELAGDEELPVLKPVL